MTNCWIEHIYCELRNILLIYLLWLSWFYSCTRVVFYWSALPHLSLFPQVHPVLVVGWSRGHTQMGGERILLFCCLYRINSLLNQKLTIALTSYLNIATLALAMILLQSKRWVWIRWSIRDGCIKAFPSFLAIADHFHVTWRMMDSKNWRHFNDNPQRHLWVLHSFVYTTLTKVVVWKKRAWNWSLNPASFPTSARRADHRVKLWSVCGGRTGFQIPFNRPTTPFRI